MRVIAGRAGGIQLHAPRSDLRPTMDVVKGAMFSSLGDWVIDARVLDLFAGTGALGLEALSRGAQRAIFVESDQRAVAAIQKNLGKTRLAGAAVQQMDVFRYLDRLAAPNTYEIIFADPPYAKIPGERDFTPELLGSDALRQALVPDGIFVLEYLPGAKLPLRDRWECLRQKRYGTTEVAFLRRTEPVAAPAAESSADPTS